MIQIVVFRSYRKQLILLADYNNKGKLVWPLDDLEFNYKFPNISVTTLPIEGLISGYYQRDGNFEKAKKLLKNSIKYNPYIKFNEYKLAKIYREQEKYDSAYFYFQNAYKSTPNNILHGSGFLEYLIAKDSFEQAKDHFYEISNRYDHHINWTQYLIYIQKKIQIIKDSINTNEFDSLLNIASKRFPDKKYFKQMELISEYGISNVIKFNVLNDSAEIKFNKNDLNKALEFYKQSVDIINDISVYQNIMMVLLKKPNYDSVKNIYYSLDIPKLEEKFVDHEKGMLDFYMGLSFLETNRDSCCKYLNLSIAKQNNLAKSVYDRACNK